ncbi:DUF2919 domain-containing protein [Shewanella sp. SE1]|nr:DUF2919 domain-containing protein [Shewanella sp. SE1]OIN16431.1 hypothetical protein BFS86_01020 [Shewanella algae]TVP14165.1 hypothetical protein AYI96_00370 [Shewanella sp. MSW]
MMSLLKFEHVRWLDNDGHIKPPLLLYIIVLFLARGWCVFVASLTQASDRAALVRLFYPEKSDFLSSLAAGAGALLIYGLILAERKRVFEALIPLFRQIRGWLVLLLGIDGVLLIQRLGHNDWLFSWNLALDALLLFWSLLYLVKSVHLRHYLNDWQKQEKLE